MSYFARLAQHSGIATPRAAATEAAATTAAPASPLEQQVETVAPPPEALPEPAPATTAAAEPTARTAEASSQPVNPREEASRVAPADPRFGQPIERRLDQQPRAIEAAAPLRAEQRSPDMPLPVTDRARVAAITPAADMDSAPSQPAPITPAADMDLTPSYAASEPKADAPTVELAPAATGEHNVARALAARDAVRADVARSVARTDPPAVGESAAGPPARDVGPMPAVPAMNAAQAQRDSPRAAKTEWDGPRDRSATPRTGGPVEVHIGTVTLQVRAPPPVAPSTPAPATPGRSDTFSPHRHYLRTW